MRRFAVRDNLGGGAGDYGLALATFGVGGAVGALAISSRRLPRRYLGAMLLLWGLGALPLADIGLAGALWVMGVVLFAVGATPPPRSNTATIAASKKIPTRLIGLFPLLTGGREACTAP